MDGRKKSQCDGRMEWNQHMSKLSIVTVYHMEMSTKTKYKVYIKTSLYIICITKFIYTFIITRKSANFRINETTWPNTWLY
jgi:hypothetical protein